MRLIIFAILSLIGLQASVVSEDLKAAPVTLGAYFCLSGDCGHDGTERLKGVRIGVSEINLAGGLFGSEMELEILDSNNTPFRVARSIFAQQGVTVVVGNFSKGQSIQGMILLGPGGRGLTSGTNDFSIPMSKSEFSLLYRKYYEQDAEEHSMEMYKTVSLFYHAALSAQSVSVSELKPKLVALLRSHSRL